MQNLNEIFRSQQLLKSINNDIDTLKKIHEIWFQLIAGNTNNTNSSSSKNNSLNPAVIEQCIPTSIRKQTLNLTCESPLIANHFRFIRQEILEEISAKGIKDITELSISVGIDQKDSSFLDANHKAKQVSQRKIDLQTISNLEEFKRSCTSESLRLSIERLLTQFKRNT